MFRNRQPAWPYRCTGKDARTGVFFFALRAGAARAFPAAGHARGREAAASPAANTAARRRPARGANRARQTRACASWDGAGGGIAGREHGGAAEGRRAAQIVRAQPARAPHGTAWAAASRQGTRRRGESRRAAQTVRAQPARAPRGMAWAAASPAANTAARRKPVRGANRARPTRACAPRDGTGGGIAGREHGGAAKAGARRRSCAQNPSGRRKTTEPCNYYHFKPYFKTLSRKSALPRSCDASNHRRLLQ